ncbi:MAG TPA: hypothetical protein VF110_08730 [Burkholderiales bacterium]|jgi:hypothetical protein
MKRKKTAPVSREEVPSGHVIERPDGFYWKDGAEQYGPFPTREEAAADMQASEAGLEPGETLQEAESELGISEWIDPDTGDPAEGSVPRIEDH